jgi:outer membrane protein assembly factor BamB
MRALCKVLIAATVLVVGSAASWSVPLPDEWPMLGGDALHNGVAPGGPGGFADLRFAQPLFDLQGRNVTLMGYSSPVVADGMVYVAVGTKQDFSYVDCEVLALDEATGVIQWHAPVGDALYDSWSSPAVDRATSTVVFGNGYGPTGKGAVYGLDTATGTPKWQAEVDQAVLNASAIVGNKVAYITDADFLGNGKLYAINLDPAHPTYAAGDVMWSQPIGMSSGNTPALKDGKVYVASVTARPGGSAPPTHYGGGIYVFDAQDGTLLKEIYPTTDYGFWGGLNFSDDHLYGCTYNFMGDGELWKIDPVTGIAPWNAPVGSTDTIPVVVNGRVFVSSGIGAYGIPQRLQCFDDATGALLWETDPFDDYGFWTFQIAAEDGKVYIVRADPFTEAPMELLLIDAALDPAHPDFIIDRYPAVGTSPALANDSLYTGGYNVDGLFSLFAFGARETDVIPEPATLALVAAGALALARRRRGH